MAPSLILLQLLQLGQHRGGIVWRREGSDHEPGQVRETARRQGRWALLTYVLITVPWVRFDWVHSAETMLRLRTTSITTITTQPLALAWTYLWYYVMFLTPHFLFQQGDPLVRHAVRFGRSSVAEPA